MTNACSKPVVVIPAFNRAESLSRLLGSIKNAYYEESPKVVISLEGEATEAVRNVALKFAAEFSDAAVKEHEKRLGLRAHIIECADYALEYGAVILLEDDLIVDRYFYMYASKALDFYENQDDVAGIALYSPQFNDFAGVSFTPVQNGYDTYPMRTPCSWGQAWSEKQWRLFRSWYATAEPEDVSCDLNLPVSLKDWPESSWKKYFAAYLEKENRYFIYPYLSYTTNCADAEGEHVKIKTDRYQANLAFQRRPVPNFKFVTPEALSTVTYDTFMEPDGDIVYRAIKLQRDEVEIDTLGIKPAELLLKKSYILTRHHVHDAIKRYPIAFRPIEVNFDFDAGENDELCLALAKSSDLLKSRKWTLEEYEYHTNFNMKSLRFLVIVIKSLPMVLARRCIGYFNGLISNKC